MHYPPLRALFLQLLEWSSTLKPGSSVLRGFLWPPAAVQRPCCRRDAPACPSTIWPAAQLDVDVLKLFFFPLISMFPEGGSVPQGALLKGI